MDDELGEHPPEMAFTKRNDTIEAFLFDRAYEPAVSENSADLTYRHVEQPLTRAQGSR